MFPASQTAHYFKVSPDKMMTKMFAKVAAKPAKLA